MSISKIMIFDCGDTLMKILNFDFEKGLKYLYDDVLDVKEDYDSFIDFEKSVHHIFKERYDNHIETSFHSFLNYLEFIYGYKTNLEFSEIEHTFAMKIYQTAMMDDAEEVLKFLKQNNVILNVFSNSMFSSIEIKKELSELGLDKYFENILSSGDHLFMKNSQEVFRSMIKKYTLLGYDVKDITYVGNSYLMDIEQPVNLGINAIHVGKFYKKHNSYLEISCYKDLLKEVDNGR